MNKVAGFFSLLCLSIGLAGCSEETSKTVTNNSEEQQTKNEEEKMKDEKTKEEKVKTTQVATMGNTSGNIMNRGIAAENEDKVLYSDSTTLYVADKSVAKQLEDAQFVSDESAASLTKVLDKVGNNGNGSIESINVMDNWIYYIKNGDIWKVKANGTGKSKVYGDNQKIERMLVYKNQVIFDVFDNETSNYILYRMDLKSKKKEEIDTHVSNFYVDNGQLYWGNMINRYPSTNYSRDNLYKIDLDKGTEAQKVAEARIMDNVQVDGDWIYFTNGPELTQMNFSGEDRLDLTDTINENFEEIALPNLTEDAIYFTKGQLLYRMDKNDKIPIAQNSVPVYAYNIVNNQIYYWGFSEGHYNLHIVPIRDIETLIAEQGQAGTLKGSGTEMNGEYYTETYDQEAEQALENEVLKFYDKIAQSKKVISIKDLENKLTEIGGGEYTLLQNHIVGATHKLLYALTNSNDKMIRELLADPSSRYHDLWDFTDEFAVNDDPWNGLNDFKIQVTSDNTVYIERDTPGHDLEVSIKFNEIDGKYYFEKFEG